MNKALEFGIQCMTSRMVSEGDAVMFDIDDTLLRTDGTPIPEMVQLFNACKVLGYETVIITARPPGKQNVRYTTEQLDMNGIKADKLVFSRASHKTMAKELLRLNFVLSVGDQDTDIMGSQHYIKLPDLVDKNIYTY